MYGLFINSWLAQAAPPPSGSFPCSPPLWCIFSLIRCIRKSLSRSTGNGVYCLRVSSCYKYRISRHRHLRNTPSFSPTLSIRSCTFLNTLKIIYTTPTSWHVRLRVERCFCGLVMFSEGSVPSEIRLLLIRRLRSTYILTCWNLNTASTGGGAFY